MPAIETVVTTMDEGEVSRFYASHHYAFGEHSYTSKHGVTIPAFSNVIVEVTLVRILGSNIYKDINKIFYKRVIKESNSYGAPCPGSVCTGNFEALSLLIYF